MYGRYGKLVQKFGQKTEGKRPLGRHRHTGGDNTGMGNKVER
jgi:hypothetical protein